MGPVEVVRILITAWANRRRKQFKFWWAGVVHQAQLEKLNASLPHQDEKGAVDRAWAIISDIDRLETSTAVLQSEYLIREARRIGAEIPPQEVGEFYGQVDVHDNYSEAWYLTPRGFLAVRSAILDAKKRRREGAMFWFGIFGSLFGMAMAVWKSLPT